MPRRDASSLRRGLLSLLALALALAGVWTFGGLRDDQAPVPVDLSRRIEIHPQEKSGEITYAYLPQYSHRVSLERQRQLVEYLSRAVGLRIRQVFPGTFDEHIKLVGQGMIDISFANPFVYVKLSRLYGARAVARIVEPGDPGSGAQAGPDSPGASFRGQIIVRADNAEIRSLDDCKGKRWIAVDPTSAGGYLYALGLFHDHGINPADFAEIAFAPGPGGKQEKVVMSVLAGQYDFGAIREGALDVITGSTRIKDIRVLASTPRYPGWVFSVRKGLDPAVAAKVRDALLALDPENPEQARILEKAGIVRIIAAGDADFDPVRELIAKIGPNAIW
ncbi:MAG: phosphate/phosphite/phosphonate ABC transporter substrate-binding protein [Desulfovibrionaceae bacterium]|nr:phosphate/phosphite/phosphonate ABC transporter substrate-binding protein [Desulfovibrionaceae bacterium]MBF0513283.1 phosphate/phosphite/phosphonate ABC transporter substrate-binding protein [Desulfovibrionaceae bacterium]